MESDPPIAPPRRRSNINNNLNNNNIELDIDNPQSGHGMDMEQGPDAFFNLHRSAFVATEEAQKLDEEGSIDAAFKGYDKALQLIDSAISLGARLLSSASSSTTMTMTSISTSQSQRVEELTLKMRIARKGMLERVSDLQHRSDASRAPPLVEPREPHLPPAYSELASALEEILEEQAAQPDPLPVNAHEVFSIPSEVQIYFISAEDNVSAPSYPSFCRLVQMSTAEPQAPRSLQSTIPAFLQVGDWTYPLIPNHSPFFRSSEGIYIFPDLTLNTPGSYVGLILPESLSPEARKTFEETLLSLVGVEHFPPMVTTHVMSGAYEEGMEAGPKEKPPRPPPPSVAPVAVIGGMIVEQDTVLADEDRKLSTIIAEGLITGAEAVSRGLIAGASKTTSLIDKGAAYIQSRIEPAKEKPVIKPEVKKGMKTAKTVTGKAVQVSGFLVTQVGKATVALGRHMAPHVHKASTKFLAKTVAVDEADASAKVDQVLEVTTGAVVSVGTVYFGLEHAARALVSSLANNTVDIVQHKYGEEAGEVAKDTAATAGNAALTAFNTKNLAPKGVAKRVAKDTGRAIIAAYKDKDGDKPNDGSSSSTQEDAGSHDPDNNKSEKEKEHDTKDKKAS